MFSDVEELSLTPSERAMAREHWDAMMFASSRTDLESARLALMDAPLPVRQAVIAVINDNWLREYEPQKEDNPFLSPVFFQDMTPIEDGVFPQQIETYHVEPMADYSAPSHPLPSSSESADSLSSYAHRFIQNINLSMPKFSGRVAPHNSSLQSASTQH